MAPLRNRSHRVQNDQDQMIEGLPIRNWRKLQSNIGAPAEEHTIVTHSRWPELPMPRDSPLLSDMSRQLLRIARLPKVSKPASQAEDHDKENAEEEEAKAKKPQDRKGFMIRKWSQMSKDWSEPDREFLAKRRKGLPSQEGYNMLYGPMGVSRAFRKLKVRRYDADGFPHVYDVMAPVGMPVEGEIVEHVQAAPLPVEPPAAPGTVIDGVGVVNEQGIVVAQATPTPNRRKPPPPPRKKKKGPFGKHSKKKIVTEYGPDGLPVHPPGPSDALTPVEGTEPGDTPMPDAQDHDEEAESGEEGEDMEESDEDHEEGDISSSATPGRSQSAEVNMAVPVDQVPATSTPTYNPSSLRSEVKFELEVSAPIEDPFVAQPSEPALTEAITQEVVMEDLGEPPAQPEFSIPKLGPESTTVDAVAEAPLAPLAPIVDDLSVIQPVAPFESPVPPAPEAILQPESIIVSTEPLVPEETPVVMDNSSPPIPKTEEPVIVEVAPPAGEGMTIALENPTISEISIPADEPNPLEVLQATPDKQEVKEVVETIETSEAGQKITETTETAEPVNSIQPEPIESVEVDKPITPTEVEEPAEPVEPVTSSNPVEPLENEAPQVKAEVLEEPSNPAEPEAPLPDVLIEEKAPLAADGEVLVQRETDTAGKEGDVMNEDPVVEPESQEPDEVKLVE